jgi:hypothetical protein
MSCTCTNIDNLDIEERVHNHAVGNQTHNFHGTWGYVHLPLQDLIDTLNWNKQDQYPNLPGSHEQGSLNDNPPANVHANASI